MVILGKFLKLSFYFGDYKPSNLLILYSELRIKIGEFSEEYHDLAGHYYNEPEHNCCVCGKVKAESYNS